MPDGESPIDLFYSAALLGERQISPAQMKPDDFLTGLPDGVVHPTFEQALRATQIQTGDMLRAQMEANQAWADKFFMASATDAEREREAVYLRWAAGKEPPFVYFLRVGPFVKIGTSKQPRIRAAAIQTTIPVEPVIVGLMLGGTKVETEQQVMFASSYIRGEWFVWSERIRKHLYLRHCRHFSKELEWRHG